MSDDGKKAVTVTQAFQGQRGALARTTPPARLQVMERILGAQPEQRVGAGGGGSGGSARTPRGRNRIASSATAQSRITGPRPSPPRRQLSGGSPLAPEEATPRRTSMSRAETTGPLSPSLPLPRLSTTNQVARSSMRKCPLGWGSGPFLLLCYPCEVLCAPPAPDPTPPACFHTDPSPDPHSLSLHVPARSQLIY